MKGAGQHVPPARTCSCKGSSEGQACAAWFCARAPLVGTRRVGLKMALTAPHATCYFMLTCCTTPKTWSAPTRIRTRVGGPACTTPCHPHSSLSWRCAPWLVAAARTCRNCHNAHTALSNTGGQGRPESSLSSRCALRPKRGVVLGEVSGSCSKPGSAALAGTLQPPKARRVNTSSRARGCSWPAARVKGAGQRAPPPSPVPTLHTLWSSVCRG